MKPNNTTPHYRFRIFLIKLNKDLFLIDEKINELSCDQNYDELHFYIMALEDRRFFSHNGIDFYSIIREFWRYITFRKCGGASTIDMQMVRTITNFRERTIFRKLYEMTLAYIINYRYSKKQIISCYLTHAFYGSGLVGIDKVIKSFNVSDLTELNDWQKALIAASLQKPKPLKSNDKWKELVTIRASYAQRVRSRIVENGKK